MVFFSQKFKSSIDEIKAAFLCYEETEKHSILNPLKPYTSYRIGIHTYLKENSISGYYETGERSRTGDLLLGKNRFYIRIKEKDGYSTVKGYIYPDPFLSLGLGLTTLSTMFTFLYSRTVENTVFLFIDIGVIAFVLFFFVKDSFLLYQDICRIFDSLSQKDHW